MTQLNVNQAQESFNSSHQKQPWVVTIFGSALLSALIALCVLFFMLLAPGTWLDPRVWMGTYQAGQTVTEMYQNAEIIIRAAEIASLWAFALSWAGFLIVSSASRFKRPDLIAR